MQHFVHYLKRKVSIVKYANADDLWFTENQPENQGFDQPSYHVTRAASGPAARVQSGDIIWLFSQLQSPWGTVPVALDAKLVVKEVMDYRLVKSREISFRYAADTGSCWFPIYDATRCLQKLKTLDGRGNTGKLIGNTGKHPGLYLRRMRQLTDPSALLALEQEVTAAGTDFISYRLADGTRGAFELCRMLMSNRQPVWWDRWSLPRRMAERREFLKDENLDAKIFQEIDKCNTVWGVESVTYSEPESYSLKEKKLAMNLGKYQPVEV